MSAKKKGHYTTVRQHKRSAKGASSTPGKAKGANCQKSPLKVQYAKNTRLHRTNPAEWERACQEVQKMQNEHGIKVVLQEFVNQ